MKVHVVSGFLRDLKKIKSKKVKSKTEQIIDSLKVATSLRDIPNVASIASKPHYYRIKVINYRLGIKVINSEVTLLRIMDRKNIYKFFP